MFLSLSLYMYIYIYTYIYIYIYIYMCICIIDNGTRTRGGPTGTLTRSGERFACRQFDRRLWSSLLQGNVNYVYMCIYIYIYIHTHTYTCRSSLMRLEHNICYPLFKGSVIPHVIVSYQTNQIWFPVLLHYSTLHYTTLCYAILYQTIINYTTLHYTQYYILYTILHTSYQYVVLYTISYPYYSTTIYYTPY